MFYLTGLVFTIGKKLLASAQRQSYQATKKESSRIVTIMETRSRQKPKKTINRVAATAALHSPPPATPAPAPTTPGAPAPPAAPSSASSTSSTSSGGRHNPLPVHVQKQLCEDIEAHGGIGVHVGLENKLYKLLNSLVEKDKLRRALYKNPGDPVRRQIQQKVYGWQKLWSEGLYEKEVLSRFGVISAAQRPNTSQIPGSKLRKRVAVTNVQEEDEEEDDANRFSPRVQEESPQVPQFDRVEESHQIPRSLNFKTPPRLRVPLPTGKTQEEDLVQEFAKMSVNSAFFFKTPEDSPYPAVDDRTCE
jgi:hypothetical protein